MAPGTTAKSRKSLDPSQGLPTVWVTLHGGVQHMAFLLEQAEDGRKLVRWATNSAIEWLDTTVPVSYELGSRRSRQRASRDGGGGGGRTLRQRQPQRKSRAGTAKATPPQELEITEAAVIQEQGTGIGNTRGTTDYAESTDNAPKETQVSTQKRKRNDWRGEASSEEEEFEFDDNNEDDEDYKDDNNEDDDDDDDAILFSAEESLSDEDYVESSTKRSKKNKRSTKRASLVRGRSKRKKREKSIDEEAIEKSVVENCDRGVEDPPVENVPLLGSTVPVDELSPVDQAREISGVVEVIEKYTSNNEVVSKDDQDNATDPLNQTDEPNVLEATATDFTRDPKENVQDVVLLDSKNGLLDKDQEANFSETTEAAPRVATENNAVSDYHIDMPSDNSTLPLEKQLIIQEVPAIGFSGAADESGNNWEINDALSLSTDGLPVDHETMIACPCGDVDEVGVILEKENNGMNPLLHDNNDSGDNDGSPLDSNNSNKTAEEIAIATSEVDVGDSGIVNENMSVIKEKQSAGQSTESDNFISKLVIQPTPKNSEHIISKDSTMIPLATKVEERKPVLQSKMIEVSKKVTVQQNPPYADNDLVPSSARVHDKESATEAFASQRSSVILGRAEMQAPTGSNKIVTGDKPIVIGRPGGESSVDKVVILERKMQLGTDLDNNTKQVRAVEAKKKAARRGVSPLRKNVGEETVLELAKPGTSLSKNKKKRQLKDSSTKTGDSSASSLGDTAPAKRVRLSKSQKRTGRSTTEERNREPAGHPQTFALNMEARERERGGRLSTMNKIAANEDVHRDVFGFETSAAPMIPANATTVAPAAYNLDARLQMALQSNHLVRVLVSQTQAPRVPPSFTRQHHDGSAIDAAVSLARQRIPLPPRNAIEVALQERGDGGTQAINITLDPASGGSSAALGQAHPPSSSSLLVSTILRNRNRPTSAHGRDPPGRFQQKKQT